MSEATETTITRSTVPTERRLSILPKYAGQHMTLFENAVYNSLGEFCEEYQGGHWTMYELSNGAFYMSPDIDSELHLSVPGNLYSGRMSADAAGIVACLFASNRLAWATHDDRFIDLYYNLRDYAGQHPEASRIFRAID